MKRIVIIGAGLAAVVLGGALAVAASQPMPPGEYTFTLPGAAELTFTISDTGDVALGALPAGYVVDEESTDEIELKAAGDALSIEIEIKADEFEFEFEDGVTEGTYTLTIPNVGQVTVAIGEDGIVDVTAANGWEVIADGDGWYLTDGTMVLGIEVDEDGFKVKVVDESLEDVLNQTDDDSDDDESDDDESHDKDDSGDDDSEDD